MNNFREVNEDILSDWLSFRDEEISTLTYKDRQHPICFDDLSDKILMNVPKQNKHYVQTQLDMLYENFTDYTTYWNEKYYKNGFVDGVQIIAGCVEN